MHSSRMRTGRSLTVCCSLLPGGMSAWWGVSAWSGGVSPWSRGSPWSGGVLLGPGGFSLVPRGMVLLGLGGWFSLVRGVLLGPGGVLLGPRRVCLVRGGSPWSRGVLLGPVGRSLETPPVYRITDTCKNITLATTSLRPVKIVAHPLHMLVL